MMMMTNHESRRRDLCRGLSWLVSATFPAGKFRWKSQSRRNRIWAKWRAVRIAPRPKSYQCDALPTRPLAPLSYDESGRRSKAFPFVNDTNNILPPVHESLSISSRFGALLRRKPTSWSRRCTARGAGCWQLSSEPQFDPLPFLPHSHLGLPSLYGRKVVPQREPRAAFYGFHEKPLYTIKEFVKRHCDGYMHCTSTSKTLQWCEMCFDRPKLLHCFTTT